LGGVAVRWAVARGVTAKRAARVIRVFIVWVMLGF
jgi:hypothetical protein